MFDPDFVPTIEKLPTITITLPSIYIGMIDSLIYKREGVDQKNPHWKAIRDAIDKQIFDPILGDIIPEIDLSGWGPNSDKGKLANLEREIMDDMFPENV